MAGCRRHTNRSSQKEYSSIKECQLVADYQHPLSMEHAQLIPWLPSGMRADNPLGSQPGQYATFIDSWLSP